MKILLKLLLHLFQLSLYLLCLSHHPFWSRSFHIPSYLLFAFATYPQNKINREQNQKAKNLIMEVVVWHGDSRSKLFNPHITLCNHSLQSHWSGVKQIWFLLYYQCWVLTMTLFGYPLRSCSFGSAGQADSHAPSDYRYGGCLIWLRDRKSVV